MTVFRQNLTCVRDEILGSLADWMVPLQQQFKVAFAVVLTIAVLVVNVLVLRQASVDQFGHDETMFRYVTLSGSHRVIRLVDEHVSALVYDASAAPSRRLLSSDSSVTVAVQIAQWKPEVFVVTLAAVIANGSGFAAPAITDASQQRQYIGRWHQATATGLSILSAFRIMTSDESRHTVTVMALDCDRSAAAALAQRIGLFHKTNSITQGV